MSTVQPAAYSQPDFGASRWRRDRMFYAGYTVVALAIVLAGFGPTYYLKADGGARLPPLVQLHAALFTAWMLLFALQVVLVASKRTDIHRRLGILGILLALAILVAGYTTAIAGARTGWTGPRTPRDLVEALNFLVVPLGDLVLFLGFLVAALYYRRQPETHKRLMMLAMAGGILPAALGRLPGTTLIPAALTLLLAGPVYDRISRRRIHTVYWWGTTIIILSLPLRLILSRAELWHRFAAWLIH